MHGAAIDQPLAQLLVFGLAAVAPVNRIRFAHGGHVGDPGDQFGMFDMGGHIQCEPLHGGVVHKKAPRLKNVISATTPSGLAAIEMRGVAVEIAL